MKIFNVLLVFISLNAIADNLDDHIELDQRYNIDTRLTQFLAEADKNEISIYTVDISYDDFLKNNNTILLDPSQKEFLENFVTLNKNGKKSIRLYFKDSNKALEVAHFYNSTIDGSTFFARKLLSHNTYFVYDRVHSKKLIVKFPRDDIKKAFKAVLVGEYLSEVFLQKKPKTFGFLSEPAVITLASGYYQILRNPKFNDISLEQLIPVHALLGFDQKGQSSGLIEKYAAVAGMTSEQWQVEYLKKLAEFVAESVFEYGVLVEGHTQNLLVKLDQNGRIEKFYFRDLTDVVVDPQITIAKKNFDSFNWNKYREIFKPMPTLFNPDFPREFNYVAGFIFRFFKQSVMAVHDEIPYANRELLFMKALLPSILKQIGFEVPSFKHAFKKITQKLGGDYSGYDDNYNRNSIDSIFKASESEIFFQQMYDDYLKRKINELKSENKVDQNTLAKEFAQLMSIDKVSFSMRDSETLIKVWLNSYLEGQDPSYILKHPLSKNFDYQKEKSDFSVSFFRTTYGGVVAYIKETNTILAISINENLKPQSRKNIFICRKLF